MTRFILKSQHVDDRFTVNPRGRSQCGQDDLIATFFAFLPDVFVHPPDQRIKEKEGLNNDLNEIHRSIPACNVSQFMSQDCLLLFG